MRRSKNWTGRIAVVAVCAFAAVPAATANAACTETTFPVRAGLVEDSYTVSGTLCRKTDPANDQTVVITAHGATYNSLYWDWPQDPETYSLVRKLVADVSVLNVDLLGSGRSSRPLSVNLTQDAQAAMLHQLVEQMRARGFRKVILLGHSSGSGTVTLEAARYGDVDGLIVTGFLHRLAPPPGGLSVPLAMYPATLDPAFQGVDPGYLTTRPGARGNPGFYNTAVADPNVIAFDDAHKDVVPALHVAGFGAIINDTSISKAVKVPVLSLVGNYDGGFCDSPQCPQAADEPAAWSDAAQLELHVIPDAGHDIHLHGAQYAAAEHGFVREWIARRFGPAVRRAARARSAGKPSAARRKARQQQLRAAKAATARYHSVARAKKDGYVQPPGPVSETCIASPAGGMGVHFANPRLIADGKLDIRRPEILLYVPSKGGRLRLVGVEYMRIDADQDLQTADDRPKLFGRPFVGPMAGHHPRQLAHYDLHVWVHRRNPRGTFPQFNPRVKC